MGESACLMRSYSQPSDVSHESKEGDPLRALTESISFGRFMSESLSWEKWSAFSHNRHLEEVEKFSKPGSVAQKKAYFEAYYKRIAAAKKEAALLEDTNTATNDVNESYITNEVHSVSSMDSKSSQTNIRVAVDKPHGSQSTNSNTELVSLDNANGCSPSVEQHELEKAKMERVESMTKEHDLVESTNQVENYNQLENVENKDEIAVTQEEMTPIKEAVERESLALTSKKKQAISSSKSSTSTRKSKLPFPAKLITPVQPRKEINATSSSKKVARDSVDKKRSITTSLHMSINRESLASISNKKQGISSSMSSTSSTKSKLPSLAMSPVQPRKEINATSSNKKVARDSVDKKRSIPTSLHMSINQEILALISNKKQGISSSKSLTSSTKSKLPFFAKLTSPVQPKKEINANSSSKKVARNGVDKKRSIPTSLHMSINQESLASISNKKQGISSSKSLTSSMKSKLPFIAKLTSPVQPRKEINATSRSKKSSKDSVEKKRSIPMSFHMSINLGSHAGETSIKTPSIAHKFENSGCLVASSRMSKDSSTPLRTAILASSSQELKHCSVTPKSETRRSRTLLDHANSGSRPADGNWHSSHFLDRTKSSNACESKIRSSTISSPFSFRSEARAAKRKEFYQKIEEKKNAAEAEKEKAENGLRKLRQSSVFRTNPVAYSNNHETARPSNHRKIPASHPQSSKFGRKPTTSIAQDTSHQPPRRPSSVKLVGSSHSIGKNNQSLTRENDPPNIFV